MKLVSHRWIKSKWFKIGVPVAILALSTGLYVFWSINTWNNYQTRFTGVQNNAQSQIKAALSLKVETSEERVKKLAALRAAQGVLPTDNDPLCRVNPTIDWQNFMGNLKEQKEKCGEAQARLARLRGTLDTVITYLENDHALAKTLGALPTGGEVAEGEWAKHRDGYKAVLKSVSELQVTEGFTPVKQVAIEKLTATVAAWEEVLTAHGAKDKARYTKATKTLAENYDGLQTVSKVSSDRLIEYIKPFEAGYIEL